VSQLVPPRAVVGDRQVAPVARASFCRRNLGEPPGTVLSVPVEGD
jgi:hypothetical protein